MAFTTLMLFQRQCVALASSLLWLRQLGKGLTRAMRPGEGA
jgi:hypothetical protein